MSGNNGEDENGDGDRPTVEASDRARERVLAFLNAATTPQEIADTVDFDVDEDARLELGRKILEKRAEGNGFRDVEEVAETPDLEPERVDDIVTTVGEELAPTAAEESHLRGVSPRHQLALMKLQRHGDTVTERLNQDQELAAEFLERPARALARMGVPVDPTLRKRLEAARPERPDRERTFCLPNGQEVTPNVNVRFVEHERNRGGGGEVE
jgi:hypothetical protein